MKTTIFAHILNEAVLLPSWLNHHKKLFSHGVILDCGSTDNSIQIINEICPTWEIVKLSKHDTCYDINKMQELESKKDGWKCILNVSEYLVIDDLIKYLTEFERLNPNSLGVRTTGIIIVDRANDTSIDNFSDPNLLIKKDFGYLEAGNAWDGNLNFNSDGHFPTTNKVYRSRLIHKHINGNYTAGRHDTGLPVKINSNLYIAWIGRGSPELYSSRCNIWKHPPSGIPLFNPSYYETMSNKEMAFKFWKSEIRKSVDIFKEISNYKKYLDALYQI